MKLLRENKKYIYEIESDYKIGDIVVFTEKCELKDLEGTIIGICSLVNETEYVISYDKSIKSGFGQSCIAKLNNTGIFSDEQIRIKL